MTRHNLIQVADPKTAAEVIANIKATRERLAASYERAQSSMAQLEATAERMRRIERVKVQIKASRSAPAVEIKSVATMQQEAIERAIEAHGARDVIEVASKASPEAYLRQLCRDEGVDIEIITGSAKTKRVVDARWRMIAAVYHRFPNLSLPKLGKVFGGKDHTAIFHALKKMGLR